MAISVAPLSRLLITVFLPVYFESVLEFSPSRAGVFLIPLSLANKGSQTDGSRDTSDFFSLSWTRALED